MIRLIAVDMDGTLLGEGGVVSARNLAAIRAAEAAGVRVVVATGRRHSYAMRQLRGLNLSDDHVLISSNGAVTRMLGYGARLLDRTFLAEETSLWLCQHLDEFRNALVVTFDLVGEDGEDARGALVVEELADLHASIERWVDQNKAYIECVVPIENALRNATPIQMMVCGTIDRMSRAEARLLEDPRVAFTGLAQPELHPEARVSLSRTQYPERNLSIVDILPAGCSKGVALTRLANEWNIPTSEILAIGDNWNDLSMFEIAGQAVLMENAPADLKTLAAERNWLIGKTNLADGVAEAIESSLLTGQAEPAGR
ncbi:MAG TPA: HAD-IIB family hydrolase [Granulicella sp.]